jgi:predicted aspartyl protease
MLVLRAIHETNRELAMSTRATKTAKGAGEVGRFNVDIELANYRDIVRAEDGVLPKNQVHRLTVSGLVDSGATRLVLPQSVVEQLGLPLGKKIKVQYADGRTAQRYLVEEVFLELLGRHSIFKAVVEPKRTTALIGAIVLEDLDLLIDCTHQRVVPRDPRGEVVEIE